jgi:Secretion system C-terminal sorting domain
MKATLFFAAIFLLSGFETIFSQEYHPMLNNSSWLLYDWVSCCRPPEERVIEQGTDVVIGSYTYKKFVDPFPSHDSNFNIISTVYIREDVAERKVYKIVNGIDTLLYDFNLQVGDTIPQYGSTFVVTEVENVNVNGGIRKKIKLNSIELFCGSRLTQIWVEGVGSNKHPFYPDYNIYIVCSSGGGYNVFTKCSFQNGEHVYGNPDCATAVELGVNEEQLSNQKITFSPNPFTTELIIQSEIAFSDSTFKMYNAVGQLVREMNNQSGKSIVLNRENLNSGLYFFQLFEKGKLVTSAKIMVD